RRHRDGDLSNAGRGRDPGAHPRSAGDTLPRPKLGRCGSDVFVGGDHPKELRIPVRSGHPEPLLRRRPDSDAQHDRYRFDRGSHAVLGDVLMNALARRLRQGRDQAGFTVLEVAVTTLILGIVLGIAYGFLVQTQSVESRSTNDAQLETLAQIAERTLSE